MAQDIKAREDGMGLSVILILIIPFDGKRAVYPPTTNVVFR